MRFTESTTYPIKFPNLPNSIEYYDEVYGLYKEAVAYLSNFNWCSKVESCYLYLNLGEKLSIFLFEIDNKASQEDRFLWVLVGDLPPIYLDIRGAKSTVDVLEIYVELAEEWIDQVKHGNTLTECFPFQVQPTEEMATLFEKKTSFIKNNVVNNIDNLSLDLPHK